MKLISDTVHFTVSEKFNGFNFNRPNDNIEKAQIRFRTKALLDIWDKGSENLVLQVTQNFSYWM